MQANYIRSQEKYKTMAKTFYTRWAGVSFKQAAGADPCLSDGGRGRPNAAVSHQTSHALEKKKTDVGLSSVAPGPGVAGAAAGGASVVGAATSPSMDAVQATRAAENESVRRALQELEQTAQALRLSTVALPDAGAAAATGASDPGEQNVPTSAADNVAAAVAAEKPDTLESRDDDIAVAAAEVLIAATAIGPPDPHTVRRGAAWGVRRRWRRDKIDVLAVLDESGPN